MKKIIYILPIFFFSIFTNAQDINLEALIKKAEVSITNYSEVFKNLSADELKTNKYFKENGNLDETRKRDRLKNLQVCRTTI